MSKTLKVTKIQLETENGKKISLSIEEAKELHAQLDELFGTDNTVYVDRGFWYRPWGSPYWSWTTIGESTYKGTGNLGNSTKITYTASEQSLTA